jgi:adenylate kinase
VITCREKSRSGSWWARLRILVPWLALISYAQAAGPVVVLIGPPGSGKTTQTEILQKQRGMAIISADDLIARNQQAFAKFKNPHIQGVEPRVDPVLNRLVEEALSSADTSKGVILDGYPAAKNHGDHLNVLRENFSLPKPIVIHLRVPDSVVRERLKAQKRVDLEQQLKDYHREFDFAREYFQETDIRDIDGTQEPAVVAAEIRKLLPK